LVLASKFNQDEKMFKRVPNFFEEIESEFGVSKEFIYENEFKIFSFLDFDLGGNDNFFKVYNKLKINKLLIKN
jgi:Zn-dependent peptidase ImmA (M78 family)